jgi:hypothetical protein
MELKYISRRIVIAGTLVIWTIKFLVRPAQLVTPPFDFFLGIAPNLIGSFLIPFCACWFFSSRYFKLSQLFRVETISELRQLSLTAFGMLILNEYLQKIPLFGRTFDLFDILFSAIGLVASYFVFSRLQQRYSISKIV